MTTNYYDAFDDMSVGYYFQKHIPISNPKVFLKAILQHKELVSSLNPEYPINDWFERHCQELINADKVDQSTVQAQLRSMDWCFAEIGMNLNERLIFYKLIIWLSS